MITLDPVTFPDLPNVRLGGGPRFNTTLMPDGDGDDESQINWDKALWHWTLHFTKASQEFGRALGFFTARRGMGYGWLFRDPQDYRDSHLNGQGLVKTLDDGKRYLVKYYPDVDEYRPYYRIIRVPILASVGFTGVSGAPAVTPYTGEITGATSDGVATFEFVSPVRFATDMMNLERNKATGAWDVEIQELRNFEVDGA